MRGWVFNERLAISSTGLTALHSWEGILLGGAGNRTTQYIKDTEKTAATYLVQGSGMTYIVMYQYTRPLQIHVKFPMFYARRSPIEETINFASFVVKPSSLLNRT